MLCTSFNNFPIRVSVSNFKLLHVDKSDALSASKLTADLALLYDDLATKCTKKKKSPGNIITEIITTTADICIVPKNKIK